MNKFKEAKNLAVITCSHVARDRHPILLVSHDLDDTGWQFLCEKREHKKEDGMIVALEEIISLDSSVLDVADLRIGYTARRKSKDGNWIITKG